MEGIPVSLMEALAYELPVISSELSGIPELVRQGFTGTLVEPGNSKLLALAFRAVFEDPGRAESMARAGRELVMQSFNLDKNAGQLAAVFQEHLHERTQV
jgi:glycosyltransferase involved in cell wall biosynthesis